MCQLFKSWPACVSGCELKGNAVSSLAPDGSFTLLLTDSDHSNEVYGKLQQALKFVFSRYY